MYNNHKMRILQFYKILNAAKLSIIIKLIPWVRDIGDYMVPSIVRITYFSRTRQLIRYRTTATLR